MTEGILQTVNGPVPPDRVVLADGHAHLWIDPAPGVAPDHRLELNRFVPILSEVQTFAAAAHADFDSQGTILIVDCQPGGAGRDAHRLSHFAREADIAIIATTGAHQRRYYAPDAPVWKMTADQAARHFIQELTVGMEETMQDPAGDHLRAGFIKIGYEGTIDGQTRVLMEASADAARTTGAAILFHTEAGRNVEALIPFYAQRGVAADRLYFCHVDKRPDFGLHRELAAAGALLGYDTWLRPKYKPEQNTYPLLTMMVDNGWEKSIAICLDLALPTMWRYRGGPGMMGLLETVIPRLRTAGIRGTTLYRLTAANVAQRLAMRAPGTLGAGGSRGFA